MLKAQRKWETPGTILADSFIFPGEAGIFAARDPNAVTRRVKRFMKAHGLPDLSPHDLRHSCATLLLGNGADIKSVQDLLGHATASFTLNVYAHTSEQMMKDTAARMQSYYDGLAAKG